MFKYNQTLLKVLATNEHNITVANKFINLITIYSHYDNEK